MTKEEVITELRVHIAINYKGKASKYADEIGVSRSFVSLVLNGIKSPSPRMLADIGVKKETVFTKVA